MQNIAFTMVLFFLKLKLIIIPYLCNSNSQVNFRKLPIIIQAEISLRSRSSRINQTRLRCPGNPSGSVPPSMASACEQKVTMTFTIQLYYTYSYYNMNLSRLFLNKYWYKITSPQLKLSSEE